MRVCVCRVIESISIAEVKLKDINIKRFLVPIHYKINLIIIGNFR